MNIKVDIDINSLLDSIDIKSLEQYIRNRKIQKIDQSNNKHTIQNKSWNMKPIKPIIIKKDNDSFDNDNFDDDSYNFEFEL